MNKSIEKSGTELSAAVNQLEATADYTCGHPPELSAGAIFDLLRWFNGNPYVSDPKMVRLALAALTWSDEFLRLGPDRLERSRNLDWASKQFGLTPKELVDLADKSSTVLKSHGQYRRPIIAFEGIDGAGKSKQLELLTRASLFQETRVRAISFPRYETFFGRQLADLLMGRHTVNADRLDSKSMALWYALDRWQAFRDLELLDTEFLLIDRFTLSSAVYQAIRTPGSESSLVDWILHLEHVELGLPVPDLYIVLDITPETAQTNVLRKGVRQYSGAESDLYERSMDLLTRARDQYLHLARRFHGIEVIDCMQDAHHMKAPDAIHDEVVALLKKCPVIASTR